MVTGSWDPETTTTRPPLSIDRQWLTRFIEWSRSKRLDELPDLLSPKQCNDLAPIMTADRSAWHDLLQPLDDDELVALIRFFTVAEMKISGWSAGESSPVVAITDVLKQRGRRLDRELLQWIKAHNDNRFLPYGPVL